MNSPQLTEREAVMIADQRLIKIKDRHTDRNGVPLLTIMVQSPSER